MTTLIDWGAESRPLKSDVRSDLLKVTPRRAAIFLPGNEALCVREALATGVVNRETVVYAVERDPETMKAIRAQLTPLFDDVRFFEGDLCDLVPDGPIDFALIDLMGSIDDRLARWLARLVEQHATPDFELAVVVAMNWRRCFFAQRVAEAAQANTELWQDLQERHQTYNRYILGYSAILHTIFRNFRVKFKRPIRYKDSRITMLAYRLHSFRRQEPEWPDLMPEIRDRGGRSPDSRGSAHDPDRSTDMSKQSEAGRKAWDTRRSKAQADERSARANRAWETRRANQAPAISKGSQAAFKAWETRRANARG